MALLDVVSSSIGSSSHRNEHSDLVDAVLRVVELVCPVVARRVVFLSGAGRQGDHRSGRFDSRPSRYGGPLLRQGPRRSERGRPGGPDLVGVAHPAGLDVHPLAGPKARQVEERSRRGVAVCSHLVVTEAAGSGAAVRAVRRCRESGVLQARASRVVGPAPVRLHDEVSEAYGRDRQRRSSRCPVAGCDCRGCSLREITGGSRRRGARTRLGHGGHERGGRRTRPLVGGLGAAASRRPESEHDEPDRGRADGEGGPGYDPLQRDLGKLDRHRDEDTPWTWP
jgi:hypothetical protein